MIGNPRDRLAGQDSQVGRKIEMAIMLTSNFDVDGQTTLTSILVDVQLEIVLKYLSLERVSSTEEVFLPVTLITEGFTSREQSTLGDDFPRSE